MSEIYEFFFFIYFIKNILIYINKKNLILTNQKCFKHYFKRLDRTFKSSCIITSSVYLTPLFQVTTVRKANQDDYLPGQISLVSVCFHVFPGVRLSSVSCITTEKDLRPPDRNELFVIVRQPGGYTTGWISLSCYSNGEHHSR